jgi:PTH1 family peptidyl-tRNA hydrolase
MAVDALASRGHAGKGREEEGAWVADGEIAGQPALFAKPLSFMNRSGWPVAALLAARGGGPADLVVVVDDVALDLSTLRVRERGSHGGHNGLRSIIDTLGTEEFPRVRIGVKRGDWPDDLADYVLSEFPPDEVLIVQEAVGAAADAVECLLLEGVAVAMNRFNARGGSGRPS